MRTVLSIARQAELAFNHYSHYESLMTLLGAYSSEPMLSQVHYLEAQPPLSCTAMVAVHSRADPYLEVGGMCCSQGCTHTHRIQPLSCLLRSLQGW